MKIQWSKKAKNDLDRIVQYVTAHFSPELGFHVKTNIDERVLNLENHPELGRKLGDHFHKRYLIFEGNTIMYEIVLNKTPMVVIRSIRPRKEFVPV